MEKTEELKNWIKTLNEKQKDNIIFELAKSTIDFGYITFDELKKWYKK